MYLLKKLFKTNWWAQKKTGLGCKKKLCFWRPSGGEPWAPDLLAESSLCVPFPCYSIVWGNQLHPHCVVCGSPVPCAPGSKTQSSPTKYKQVQTFWNNKSSKYDFYFNMIIVAHVLPGWMTQERQSLLRESWRAVWHGRAKLVQPAAVLHAWTRLGSKLSCLLRLDFLEKSHCTAARFSFQNERVSLLCCWWGDWGWEWNKKLLKCGVAAVVV